ncbi:MAG: hypothetical protein ABI923_09655 [bacterium]
MKKVTILCLWLLVSGTPLAMAGHTAAQNSDDAFQSFWQKFKTAVISGDKETVAALSRFPIVMPHGVRSIKKSAELRQRYREVFNKATNPAECFAKAEPAKDTNNPKRFFVSCFDNLGYEIDYEFERTRMGWKFVQLEKTALPD